MKRLMKRSMLLGSLAMPLLLGGCAAPSESLTMGVGAADALQLRGFMPEVLRGQIALGEVGGGAETNMLWGSQISDAALARALEDSLRAVGLLPQQPQLARYRLTAAIIELQQPMIAPLDAKVTVTMHYKLLDAANGDAIVYERRLRSAHTAEFGAAMLSPSERLRLANEAAVRAGIVQLLRELPTLRF